MSVQFYISKFESVRPDRSSGHAKPHKVCLLFAIMDLIEEGKILDNRIYYNEQLKLRFTHHFNILKRETDRNSPFLPFYHLRSSKFWHLKIKSGQENNFKDIKAASDKNISELVEYGYFDTELFDYLKSPLTRSALKHTLMVNLDNLEIQFQRWITSIGKSDKTAKNYTQALKGSINTWMQDNSISNQNLLSIASPVAYETITSKIYELEEFKEKNKKGNGMYSAALKTYKTFLEDINKVDMQADIEDIIISTTIPETQKATLVNTRIGQGKFRDDLIQYWQGCALTSYKKYNFLIASHIKPWKNSDDTERLDKYNGLLLLANIDKAFDLGYISFSEKGKILISPELDDYETLGIYEHMQIDLHKRHQDYLAHHRGITFRV